MFAFIDRLLKITVTLMHCYMYFISSKPMVSNGSQVLYRRNTQCPSVETVLWVKLFEDRLNILPSSPSNAFLWSLNSFFPTDMQKRVWCMEWTLHWVSRAVASVWVKEVQNGPSPKILHSWINPHPHSQSFLLPSSSFLLLSLTSKALNINLCYDIHF